MERLFYSVYQSGKNWAVSTIAPGPDALAREFSTRTEAITVATIAARIEWEHLQTPTGVFLKDSLTGEVSVEVVFG